jgi:CDP-paratose 2-epimerase
MANRMLVTGGAGFIGVNASRAFAKKGWNVTVLDDLSRRGADKNLDWLKEHASVDFKKIDVRNKEAIEALFSGTPFDVVLHLAAQVAVTTSVSEPRNDFETNALGTFNVLEAMRKFCPKALMIFASTNKVYGKMENIAVVERNGRYEYGELSRGVSEHQQLDFHSPYGCSKGAADQYVLDYSRIYGLRTTSFRQSCIYGPRQFGIEDQGWVAWFAIATVLNKPITIFGDGKQIRDVLHVDDLTRAYEAAIAFPDKSSGQAFNIGGGVNNTLSLLELISILETETGRRVPLKFEAWRPGDQPVFVCDLSKVQQSLSWTPVVGVEDGVRRLVKWVKTNQSLF